MSCKSPHHNPAFVCQYNLFAVGRKGGETLLGMEKAFAAGFQGCTHFPTHPGRLGTAFHSASQGGSRPPRQSLLGQTSGCCRINGMVARMCCYTCLHTLEGEQARKAKRRREAPLSLDCHFYLRKAGVEAEEWGTAVGSDTQGGKDQSLYHLHTNTVVMGRQTNW